MNNKKTQNHENRLPIFKGIPKADRVETLTKDYLHAIKGEGAEAFAFLLDQYKEDTQQLLYLLSNSGKLSIEIVNRCIVPLLSNHNERIRWVAIKHIGKLQDEQFITLLNKAVQEDDSPYVRREAISSIGKIGSQAAMDPLLNALTDEDPRLVRRAIKGLLKFRGDRQVELQLKELRRHEEPMIKGLVNQLHLDTPCADGSGLPHPNTFDFLVNTVIGGNELEAMRYIPAQSVHLTVTCLPTYQGGQGEASNYQDYLKQLVAIFQETHRITKEGRFLVVISAPAIIPRISRAHMSKRYATPFDIHHYLIQKGWDFIDDIVFKKSEHSGKNRNGSFQQHRKPLGYKPNPITEYIMVYRKHTDKLIDWNIKQYDLSTVERSKVKDGFETTNIWQTKPRNDGLTEAFKQVIEYYSFQGDLVFDPFGGNGITGKTAQVTGRKFLLLQGKAQDFERTLLLHEQRKLFNDVPTKILSLGQFALIAKE